MDKIAFALAGHSADSATLPDARRLFTGRSAWVTPTLASLRVLDGVGTAEYAARFRRAEMEYVDSGSLATSRRPVGVMVAGRWLDRTQLDSALASRARSSPPERE